MKRSFTFKSVLIGASLVSLAAFAFVNLSVNSSTIPPFSGISAVASDKYNEEGIEETREIKVPDVTVLGRVYGIVKKTLGKTH